MTSKEALEKLGWRLTSYEEDLELRRLAEKEIEMVKQDLERLEALEKENKPYLELLTNNAKYQNDNQILQQENQDLWQQIENYNHKFAEVERKKADLMQQNEKLKKIIIANFWVFNDEVLFKFNELIPEMQEEIKEVLNNE